MSCEFGYTDCKNENKRCDLCFDASYYVPIKKKVNTLRKRNNEKPTGRMGEHFERHNHKDVKNNILYVSQGDQSMIYHSNLECDNFNYITYKPSEESFRCTVRIRHRQPEQAATAYINGDGLKISFDNPQRAIAEGQYAVVYVNDICLGGGVIERKY